MFVLIGFILQEFIKKYNERNIFVIFFILALVLFFDKISTFNNATKILSNKYNFYETLEDEVIKK